jgi:hypothetical protein
MVRKPAEQLNLRRGTVSLLDFKCFHLPVTFYVQRRNEEAFAVSLSHGHSMRDDNFQNKSRDLVVESDVKQFSTCSQPGLEAKSQSELSSTSLPDIPIW